MTAKIVAVHGVAHQYSGERSMHKDWYPAMADGAGLAGGTLVPDDLRCAFYGNLFRKEAEPAAGAVDIALGEYGRDTLQVWEAEAAATDPSVPPPDVETLGTPMWVQRALRALQNSKFFGDLTLWALVGALRQMRQYFTDPDVRADVRGCVERAIGPDTRVVVGHSLGSVVAYEALCAHPEWPVRALVTLGSPLGIQNLVFRRLQPRPVHDEWTGHLLGCWPGDPSHLRWTNVAARGDVVALVKDLNGSFGPFRVTDWIIDTGMKAHDARRYLTEKQTGQAIVTGLADG